MQQTLVWKPWHNPGVENLRLNIDEHGINATSHLIQSLQGQSIAATYVLNCDPRWRFRRLWLKVDNHGQRSINLKRDIRGNWLHNGEPRPDLSDCQQVMLSDSPFTHTPALQRCALETGQSELMQVAYVDLLTLKVEARSQRYQRLREEGGTTQRSAGQKEQRADRRRACLAGQSQRPVSAHELAGFEVEYLGLGRPQTTKSLD